MTTILMEQLSAGDVIEVKSGDDVITVLVLLATDELLVCGEPDRMAEATAAILQRDLVPLGVLRPWVKRIANAAVAATDAGNPYANTFNPQSFLRALYLKLAFSSPAPSVRADLLLELIDQLRRTNPHHLTSG